MIETNISRPCPASWRSMLPHLCRELFACRRMNKSTQFLCLAVFSVLSVPEMAAVDGNKSMVPDSKAIVPGTVPGQTDLVRVNEDGSLSYKPYTVQGDMIPDFSHCGYGGGIHALPSAPVKEVLDLVPGNGDDTRRIQDAIDRVSRLPMQQGGIRGAVLLRKGRYRCSETLLLHTSGVVLRGEGDGRDGTLIVATARKQQPMIRIGSTEREAVSPMSMSPRELVDDYVPVGARTVTVGNTSGLSVGQTVLIVRRGNAAWISAIGMDRIKPRPGNPKSTKQWKPFDLSFDRMITSIQGNRVTFDAPIACAIDRKWGGGSIVPYKDGRIQQCGVEHLRADSIYDPSIKEKGHLTDEQHATYLVHFESVKNAWAKGLTTEHFYHGPANLGRQAKWITVEDCRSLNPVSMVTGGRRYPYHISDAQLSLVQRCYSDGARHAFVVGARVPGPNVFLDCCSEHDYGSSEPHHRWSVGGLYDNVKANIAIQDRQWMGSGHGWAGANYVVWNCRGNLICQRPPTAQNFSIGFVGRKSNGVFGRSAGWWESTGTPVQPESLYKAQLEARKRTATSSGK